MSRGRMEDVRDALQAAGWNLLTDKPFRLEDDSARWELAHRDATRVAELHFHAFADLGQRTSDLRDILYCLDRTSGAKLYFDKRQSPEWKSNLQQFVLSLEAKRDDS